MKTTFALSPEHIISATKRSRTLWRSKSYLPGSECCAPWSSLRVRLTGPLRAWASFARSHRLLHRWFLENRLCQSRAHRSWVLSRSVCRSRSRRYCWATRRPLLPRSPPSKAIGSRRCLEGMIASRPGMSRSFDLHVRAWISEEELEMVYFFRVQKIKLRVCFGSKRSVHLPNDFTLKTFNIFKVVQIWKVRLTTWKRRHFLSLKV